MNSHHYKERWQAYTLAEMFQSPNKGMQDELYRAMVVAKEKGLLAGSESKWDEALNKADTIELMINAQLALNKDHGYLTNTEYATIEAPADTLDTEVNTDAGQITAKAPEPLVEQPPVAVIYNERADTNSDGTISKTEWEAWVKANPADTDKDMVITDTEKKVYSDSQKPATSSQSEVKKPISSGSTSSGKTSTSSGSKTSSGSTTKNPTTPAKPSTSGGDRDMEAEKKAANDAGDELLEWAGGANQGPSETVGADE